MFKAQGPLPNAQVQRVILPYFFPSKTWSTYETVKAKTASHVVSCLGCFKYTI